MNYIKRVSSKVFYWIFGIDQKTGEYNAEEGILAEAQGICFLKKGEIVSRGKHWEYQKSLDHIIIVPNRKGTDVLEVATGNVEYTDYLQVQEGNILYNNDRTDIPIHFNPYNTTTVVDLDLFSDPPIIENTTTKNITDFQQKFEVQNVNSRNYAVPASLYSSYFDRSSIATTIPAPLYQATNRHIYNGRRYNNNIGFSQFKYHNFDITVLGDLIAYNGLTIQTIKDDYSARVTRLSNTPIINGTNPAEEYVTAPQYKILIPVPAGAEQRKYLKNFVIKSTVSGEKQLNIILAPSSEASSGENISRDPYFIGGATEDRFAFSSPLTGNETQTQIVEAITASINKSTLVLVDSKRAFEADATKNPLLAIESSPAVSSRPLRITSMTHADRSNEGFSRSENFIRRVSDADETNQLVEGVYITWSDSPITSVRPTVRDIPRVAFSISIDTRQTSWLSFFNRRLASSEITIPSSNNVGGDWETRSKDSNISYVLSSDSTFSSGTTDRYNNYRESFVESSLDRVNGLYQYDTEDRTLSDVIERLATTRKYSVVLFSNVDGTEVHSQLSDKIEIIKTDDVNSIPRFKLRLNGEIKSNIREHGMQVRVYRESIDDTVVQETGLTNHCIGEFVVANDYTINEHIGLNVIGINNEDESTTGESITGYIIEDLTRTGYTLGTTPESSGVRDAPGIHSSNRATINNLVSFKGFLFGVDARDHLIFSAYKTIEEQYSFPLENTYSVPDGVGNITALSILEDALIVFKKYNIYAITADTTGRTVSSIQHTEILTNHVGADAATSVLRTDKGIYFLSEKGLHFIDRSFQVSYVGGMIEDLIPPETPTDVLESIELWPESQRAFATALSTNIHNLIINTTAASSNPVFSITHSTINRASKIITTLRKLLDHVPSVTTENTVIITENYDDAGAISGETRTTISDIPALRAAFAAINTPRAEGDIFTYNTDTFVDANYGLFHFLVRPVGTHAREATLFIEAKVLGSTQAGAIISTGKNWFGERFGTHTLIGDVMYSIGGIFQSFNSKNIAETHYHTTVREVNVREHSFVETSIQGDAPNYVARRAGSVAIGTDIYMAGGQTNIPGAFVEEREIVKYDTVNNAMTIIVSGVGEGAPPAVGSSPAMYVYDNILYIIGSLESISVDLETREWKHIFERNTSTGLAQGEDVHHSPILGYSIRAKWFSILEYAGALPHAFVYTPAHVEPNPSLISSFVSDDTKELEFYLNNGKVLIFNTEFKKWSSDVTQIDENAVRQIPHTRFKGWAKSTHGDLIILNPSRPEYIIETKKINPYPSGDNMVLDSVEIIGDVENTKVTLEYEGGAPTHSTTIVDGVDRTRIGSGYSCRNVKIRIENVDIVPEPLPNVVTPAVTVPGIRANGVDTPGVLLDSEGNVVPVGGTTPESITPAVTTPGLRINGVDTRGETLDPQGVQYPVGTVLPAYTTPAVTVIGYSVNGVETQGATLDDQGNQYPLGTVIPDITPAVTAFGVRINGVDTRGETLNPQGVQYPVGTVLPAYTTPAVTVIGYSVNGVETQGATLDDQGNQYPLGTVIPDVTPAITDFGVRINGVDTRGATLDPQGVQYPVGTVLPAYTTPAGLVIGYSVNGVETVGATLDSEGNQYPLGTVIPDITPAVTAPGVEIDGVRTQGATLNPQGVQYPVGTVLPGIVTPAVTAFGYRTGGMTPAVTVPGVRTGTVETQGATLDSEGNQYPVGTTLPGLVTPAVTAFGYRTGGVSTSTSNYDTFTQLSRPFTNTRWSESLTSSGSFRFAHLIRFNSNDYIIGGGVPDFLYKANSTNEFVSTGVQAPHGTNRSVRVHSRQGVEFGGCMIWIGGRDDNRQVSVLKPDETFNTYTTSSPRYNRTADLIIFNNKLYICNPYGTAWEITVDAAYNLTFGTAINFTSAINDPGTASYNVFVHNNIIRIVWVNGASSRVYSISNADFSGITELTTNTGLKALLTSMPLLLVNQKRAFKVINDRLIMVDRYGFIATSDNFTDWTVRRTATQALDTPFNDAVGCYTYNGRLILRGTSAFSFSGAYALPRQNTIVPGVASPIVNVTEPTLDPLGVQYPVGTVVPGSDPVKTITLVTITAAITGAMRTIIDFIITAATNTPVVNVTEPTLDPSGVQYPEGTVLPAVTTPASSDISMLEPAGWDLTAFYAAKGAAAPIGTMFQFLGRIFISGTASGEFWELIDGAFVNAGLYIGYFRTQQLGKNPSWSVEFQGRMLFYDRRRNYIYSLASDLTVQYIGVNILMVGLVKLGDRLYLIEEGTTPAIREVTLAANGAPILGAPGTPMSFLDAVGSVNHPGNIDSTDNFQFIVHEDQVYLFRVFRGVLKVWRSENLSFQNFEYITTNQPAIFAAHPTETTYNRENLSSGYTDFPTPPGSSFQNVFSYNGLLYYIGGSGFIASSPDGITWTTVNAGVAGDDYWLAFQTNEGFVISKPYIFDTSTGATSPAPIRKTLSTPASTTPVKTITLVTITAAITGLMRTIIDIIITAAIVRPSKTIINIMTSAAIENPARTIIDFIVTAAIVRPSKTIINIITQAAILNPIRTIIDIIVTAAIIRPSKTIINIITQAAILNPLRTIIDIIVTALIRIPERTSVEIVTVPEIITNPADPVVTPPSYDLVLLPYTYRGALWSFTNTRDNLRYSTPFEYNGNTYLIGGSDENIDGYLYKLNEHNEFISTGTRAPNNLISPIYELSLHSTQGVDFQGFKVWAVGGDTRLIHLVVLRPDETFTILEGGGGFNHITSSELVVYLGNLYLVNPYSSARRLLLDADGNITSPSDIFFDPDSSVLNNSGINYNVFAFVGGIWIVDVNGANSIMYNLNHADLDLTGGVISALLLEDAVGYATEAAFLAMVTEHNITRVSFKRGFRVVGNKLYFCSINGFIAVTEDMLTWTVIRTTAQAAADTRFNIVTGIYKFGDKLGIRGSTTDATPSNLFGLPTVVDIEDTVVTPPPLVAPPSLIKLQGIQINTKRVNKKFGKKN